MIDDERIETILNAHGYEDYKWIDPSHIVVSLWVRLKCEYGCPSYGKVASCPPNTPSIADCRRFFSEYSQGLVLHFTKIAPEKEKRMAWSKAVNLQLVRLEQAVFKAGYQKAFLLFMDSCEICAECTPQRVDCKKPKLSRPSPEGMAVDVFSTVRKLGYPIDVLTDRKQMMNRYAFLMVE